MSIALAALCRDGLVLCADSQIGTTDFKFYESKLSTIVLAPSGRTMVLAYAGSPDTMRVILQKLRDRLEHANKSYEQIQLDLQQTLDTVLPKSSKDSHQILCGLCDGGTLHLTKSFNRNISPVPVWDCVGFGDSALTRYLGAIFLGTEIHLPLFRAVPICNYMIAQAKKYVQGCGGPTDLFVLAPSGQVLEQSFSPVVDTMCALIEQNFNLLLTSATEPDVGAERCETLIKQLRTLLETSTKGFQAFLH